MKGLATAFAVLILACACGHQPIYEPPKSPGFDVTATEKDHAVTMRVDQTLGVILHGGGKINYQQVTSSDLSTLAPISGSDTSATNGETVVATFKAVRPGGVKVTAVGSPVCPKGAACPMYAMLYELSVAVTQ